MRRNVEALVALVVVGCGSVVELPAGQAQDGAVPPQPSATPGASGAPQPPPPAPCQDGVRGGDESDVDCGGATCARCGDERGCGLDADCRGGRCVQGICRSLVVDVAAGGDHTCALYAGGSVRCWGRSHRGQLGLGTTASRGTTPATVPSALPAVDLGKNRFAVAIRAGAGSTCALLEGGLVACWGANVGATGPGTNPDKGIYPEQMGEALTTIDLGTGRTARAVTCGTDHWCARLDDATVKCWGNDFDGRLGNGIEVPLEAMGDARPPVRLGTGRTAKEVIAGGTHSCAILDDASLKCWGGNRAGGLGLGGALFWGIRAAEMGDNLPRVDLGAGRTVKQVALGHAHSCAILGDDSLKCWGMNVSGELGLGDTTSRGTDLAQMGDALPTVDLGPGRRARLVATSPSATYTCVVLDDDHVRCFGWNPSGQLGQGDTIQRGSDPASIPSAIPPVDLGGPVTKISVGGQHACALLASGIVKCWGGNAYGQLGLGDTEARGDQPSEMGAALPAVSLTAP